MSQCPLKTAWHIARYGVLTRAHLKLYKSIVYLLLCAAVELEGVCVWILMPCNWHTNWLLQEGMSNCTKALMGHLLPSPSWHRYYGAHCHLNCTQGFDGVVDFVLIGDRFKQPTAATYGQPEKIFPSAALAFIFHLCRYCQLALFGRCNIASVRHCLHLRCLAPDAIG